MKRLISLCLSFLLCCWMVCFIPLTALAANFSNSYSLTGEPGIDLARIALAQENRNGAQMGYDYDWCAAFISDCAQIIDQGDAIPWDSFVSGLNTKIRNADGYDSTGAPQIGDIAFINWDGGSSPQHVEIVYAVEGSTVYTIGGNSGLNDGTVKTRYVCKHKFSPSYNRIVFTLHPNYHKNSDKPIGHEISESEAAGRTIPDGDYCIQSTISGNFFIDPAPGTDVPAPIESNVQLFNFGGGLPSSYDTWTFTYLNNGFYKITQKGTDMCMDVAGVDMHSEANVYLWTYGGGANQMWSVRQVGNGYSIQAKHSGFYLDAAGGKPENCNIWVYEWNGSAAQIYNLIPYSDHTFKGNGTAASPYQISSAEDLCELAKCINNELSRSYYADKYYIQTADIDLENQAFIPIGTRTEGNPGGGGFSGVYDGAKHSVTGLNVKRSDQAYNGLFGWCYGGTIKNLSVSGSVDARSPAGGIVGEIGSGLSGTIENCSFTGTVNGSAAAGGIVGHIWCSGSIKNCYFNGSLSTDTESGITGGIVANVSAGYNESAGTITLTNCYAASKLAVIGGIIGNFKTVVASTTNIQNNFYLKSMASAGSNGDLKSGSSALTDELLKSESAEMLGAPFAQNDDANLNDGYPVFAWQTTPYQFQGEGTDASPYLITSKKELEIFRDLMNTEYRAAAYNQASYKLTTDIDLSDSAWIPIAKRYLDGKDTGIKFCGHFDGGNHTVSGMSVNEKSKFAGFFGSISSGAVVENMIVKGNVVNTTLSTGGIVGEMCAGEATVRNCAFIGNVTGVDQAVGGVVGNLWQNGTVQNCYHIGTVTCPDHSAGGVVGKAFCETANTIGLIENCYHAGKLSGTTGSVIGLLSEKADIKAYVIVRNCFGLKADDALCGGGECVEFDAMQCNESTLQKAAPLLGDAFAANPDSTYINGYPVLAWELDQSYTVTTTTTTSTIKKPTTTTTTTTSTTKKPTTTTTTTTSTTQKPTTTTTTTTSTTQKPTTTTTTTTSTTQKPTTTTTTTTSTTQKPTTTTTTTTSTTQKPTTTTTTTTSTTKKSTTMTIITKATTTTTTIITKPILKIDKTSVTMTNGDQYTITANRNDVTYKSNNLDVAIVSQNGVITAVGVGQAIISAFDSDSNVVQIKVEVTAITTTPTTLTTTMTTSDTQKPTTKTTTTMTTITTKPALKIDKTSVTMTNGDQYTITANRNDVTYKSNNLDVAIVSQNGVITAVGVGQAIISAFDSDSNVVQIKVEVTAITTPTTTTTANPTTTITTSTTAKPTTTVTTSTTTSTNEPLIGDVNGDGEVSIADAVLLCRITAEDSCEDVTLTDQCFVAADYDKDNLISILDVVKLLAYLRAHPVT